MNEDYGDTILSKPHKIGFPVEGEVAAAISLKKYHISDGAELGGKGKDFLLALI